MDTLGRAVNTISQHWCVAYTLPRHEKAIAEHLGMESISSYLPLYSEVRLWRQRRIQVELPLFPGYIFIRIFAKDKSRVLSRPGVIRLLTMNGDTAVFPDEEMEMLQSSVAKWNAKPYPFLVSGKRVRIKSGPFAGLEGTIARRKGKRTLIVTLDLIHSSMSLDMDAAEAQLAS